MEPSWRYYAGIGLLPRPPKKKVEHYIYTRCIPLIALLGYYDGWRLAIQIVEDKKDKRRMISMPSVFFMKKRLQKMEHALTDAFVYKDRKRIQELRLMCTYYNAQEVMSIYENVFFAVMNEIPERNENFITWLNRLERMDKIKYRGKKGWGRHVVGVI